MGAAGGPGVQVHHRSIGIHEGKSIGKPGNVAADLGPSEPLRVISKGIPERHRIAAVLGDDEGREAIRNPLRMTGAGFHSNVADEVVEVPQVLRRSRQKQGGSDQKEEGGAPG